MEAATKSLTEKGLSVSSLNRWQRCRREFSFTKILGLRSAGVRHPAEFGKAMHVALELRYRLAGGRALDEVQLNQCIDAGTAHLQQHGSADPGWRNAERLAELFRGYNERYPTETWEPLRVVGQDFLEHRFRVQVPGTPVPFIGIIDLVAIDKGNQWFIWDHKTAAMLGEGNFLAEEISWQYPAYAWAIRHLIGITPIGVVVNFIRTRPPETKRGEKEFPRPVKPDDFQRMTKYFLPHELDEFEETFRKESLEMLATINYTCSHYSCVRKDHVCDFIEVCKLPFDQRDVLLQSEAFEQDKVPEL